MRADRLIRLAGELRVPDGSHLILCPARFDEDRGQKILIQAIKRLGRDDVFCLLLGSTRHADAVREGAGARDRGAPSCTAAMQIGPYVDDMPAAYMLADVVVATGGARQGFSRALVEAQAMGRPVVAEDGGGAAETVRPGVTGWLAPAGDPAALAEALQQRSVAHDRATRRACARRAGAGAQPLWTGPRQSPVDRALRADVAAMRCAAILVLFLAAMLPVSASWLRWRGPPAGGVLDRFLAPPSGVQQLPRQLEPHLGRSVNPKCPCHGTLTIRHPGRWRAQRLLVDQKCAAVVLLGEVALRQQRLGRSLRPARRPSTFP